MRDGPGMPHPIVTSIPAGSENVQQVGPCVGPDDRVSGYNWCNVEWNGKIGWVSMIGLEAPQGQHRSINSSQVENVATSLRNHNGSIMRLSASGLLGRSLTSARGKGCNRLAFERETYCSKEPVTVLRLRGLLASSAHYVACISTRLQGSSLKARGE
jgi:hypothetical protein